MKMAVKTTVESIHAALTVALLAACAANLVLVCVWL
jgi:hypothetical protein